MSDTFWVPEAPGHSGLYATIPTPTRNCTYSIHAALRFFTREECEAWIAEHPSPMWVPVEHGFMAPDAGGEETP